MKRLQPLLFICMVLSQLSAQAAEFVIDRSPQAIYKGTNVKTLNDLSEGEEALVYAITNFCYGKDKQLFLSGDTELETETYEGSSYLRVKVLSQNSLSIKLVPAETDKSGKDVLILVLHFIAKADRCGIRSDLGFHKPKQYFSIKDIEGESTASGLISTWQQRNKASNRKEAASN